MNLPVLCSVGKILNAANRKIGHRHALWLVVGMNLTLATTTRVAQEEKQAEKREIMWFFYTVLKSLLC